MEDSVSNCLPVSSQQQAAFNKNANTLRTSSLQSLPFLSSQTPHVPHGIMGKATTALTSKLKNVSEDVQS